jgi:diguanylate cyclase (GGDEF)-like protein
MPREGVVWLHFTLENRSDKEEWAIENSMNLELMEFYLRTGDGWHHIQRTGNMIPFAGRELPVRHPAATFSLPSGEQRQLLIRVFDYQSASLQLSLMDEAQFNRRYADKTLLLGLAFGFFSAFILYNLIIFFLNRERTYLLYSLYMTAFFFNQLAQERLLSQYLQPHSPYGFFWFILFGGASAFFGIEFFRSFINTASHMPRLDRLMRLLRYPLLLLIVSAFLYAGPVSADILNILSMLAMALIFTALILRIIKHDLLALVCLLGSLLYLAGTIGEIAVTLWPLPVTPFTLHAQLYGAIAQVIFIGFAVGANTYRLRRAYDRMQKNFTDKLEHLVTERTRQLEEANRRLAEHAVKDGLTGLYNRGELERRIRELDTYVSRKSDSHGSYVISAAYLDLDNFKQCNDTYGHAYGDDILNRTAEILRNGTRGYDIIFRLGGDEFLIVFTETALQEAEAIMERMRRTIEEELGAEARISASIGLASSEHPEASSMTELIRLADAALLRSKEEGKNGIRLAGA